MTVRDLSDWEAELTAEAQGLIGGDDDFVQWAHHKLDDRMPLGLKLRVSYNHDGQSFKLEVRPDAEPVIEVIDFRRHA